MYDLDAFPEHLEERAAATDIATGAMADIMGEVREIATCAHDHDASLASVVARSANMAVALLLQCNRGLLDDSGCATTPTLDDDSTQDDLEAVLVLGELALLRYARVGRAASQLLVDALGWWSFRAVCESDEAVSHSDSVMSATIPEDEADETMELIARIIELITRLDNVAQYSEQSFCRLAPADVVGAWNPGLLLKEGDFQ